MADVDVMLPEHDLNMPHDARAVVEPRLLGDPYGIAGCPPNCPRRTAVQGPPLRGVHVVDSEGCLWTLVGTSHVARILHDGIVEGMSLEELITTRDPVTPLRDALIPRSPAAMPGKPPWRVGQHYNLHVYEGDRPVATFHSPPDAEVAVQAVNAAREVR